MSLFPPSYRLGSITVKICRAMYSCIESVNEQTKKERERHLAATMVSGPLLRGCFLLLLFLVAAVADAFLVYPLPHVPQKIPGEPHCWADGTIVTLRCAFSGLFCNF